MNRDRNPRTVDVPLSTYVDVVNPKGVALRSYIDLTLQVPDADPLPIAARFEMGNGWRSELHGHAGRTYQELAPCHGTARDGGGTQLYALSDYALAGGLPSKHAISGDTVWHLVPESIGRWGVDDFAGWDLSAAEPRIGHLQERAAALLVHSGGRLFKQAQPPVWWADHVVNVVRLVQHPPGMAPGATVFGLRQLPEAIRLLEIWSRRRPEVSGTLEHLDPAFYPVDGTVLLARELARWAVVLTQNEVLEMRADLVRSWANLRHGPDELQDDDAEGARQIVREAVGFLDAHLDAVGGRARYAKYLDHQWRVSKTRVAEIEGIRPDPVHAGHGGGRGLRATP